jgi:RNA polymerase sigma-70 factor (ECF subfamily)
MSMQTMEDNQLVEIYIKGSEDALAELITRHKRRIYTFIFLIVRKKDLAEDIFQDTFVKVIQTLKRGQYYEDGKFLPWVLRISRNLIIDHFRRIKKMPTLNFIKNEDGEETDIFSILPLVQPEYEQTDKQEFRQVMRKLIDVLPMEQKEVLMMRMYYDMSFKEIAEITNVSINTSLGRMRYALINLKKMLEEKNIEIYI